MEKLRHSSQYRLVQLLSRFGQGKKDIVIHESLMKALDQIAGARFLRDNGVDKIFKLEQVLPNWKNPVRIYFIPSVYTAAKEVCTQLQGVTPAAGSPSKHVEYHLICVPAALYVIKELLESEGILDRVQLHEFSWDYIPLDRSLATLDFNFIFASCFVDEDDLFLSTVAKSLLSFECLFGAIPHVTILGSKATVIHKLLEVWRKELQPTLPADREFSQLILIDRDVDLVSLLLTQLSYEGVLDENFGLQCGFVTLPAGATGSSETQRLMLNCARDEIYAEVSGRHISAVFQHLSAKAKQLQAQYDKRNTLSVAEMKQFVSSDMKQIQTQQKLLAMHISACETLMKRNSGILEEHLLVERNIMEDKNLKECLSYVEDSMARRFNMPSTLRLLCLYCAMQDGLPEREFKALYKQFLHAYGYQHLPTICNLNKLGLFYPKDAKIPLDPNLADKLAKVVNIGKPEIPSFRKIAKKFAPEDEEIDVKAGQHPSYVFGGLYSPLIYGLVEKVLLQKPLDDYARLFGNKLRTYSSEAAAVDDMGKTLVLFIGGVTLAEAAALDLLSRKISRDIYVLSTNIISGTSFVNLISSTQ